MSLSETKITFPEKDTILALLNKEVSDSPQCGEQFLPEEIAKLAGQTFITQGYVTVLLCAVKEVLRKAYRGEPDMASENAFFLSSRSLPKFIKKLVENEDLQELIIDDIDDQMRAGIF